MPAARRPGAVRARPSEPPRLLDDAGYLLSRTGGMAVRAFWRPGPRFEAGLDVATKQGLEVAFVLLGAGVSLSLVRQAGLATLVGIVAAVVLLAFGAWFALRGVGPFRTDVVNQAVSADGARYMSLATYPSSSRATSSPIGPG